MIRSQKIVSLFPAGTSSADLPGKTNAKPLIWTDHDKFMAVPVALHEHATKVSALIKTGTRRKSARPKPIWARTAAAPATAPSASR